MTQPSDEQRQPRGAGIPEHVAKALERQRARFDAAENRFQAERDLLISMLMRYYLDKGYSGDALAKATGYTKQRVSQWAIQERARRAEGS